VLSSATLIDKSAEYNFLKPWLKEGLGTSSGKKWKTRRKILTPAFHFRILEDFQPIINEQTSVLIEKLRFISRTTCNINNNESKDEDRCVDIVPIITLCTLDVICETAVSVI
jgi:cytochrome P450